MLNWVGGSMGAGLGVSSLFHTHTPSFTPQTHPNNQSLLFQTVKRFFDIFIFDIFTFSVIQVNQ
jgi:hypothetical protein